MSNNVGWLNREVFGWPDKSLWLIKYASFN